MVKQTLYKNWPIFFFLFLVSCGGYNKVLRGDDYKEKRAMANKYYEEEEWARAAALYEQIYQRFSRSVAGEEAYYRLGKSTYKMGDYILGPYYLKSFSDRFPGSKYCEETAFLGALCSVKKSPKYSLDQTDTKLALTDLQNFVDMYPLSKLVDSCNRVMDRLHAKLELKTYKSAMLYYKLENYRASVAAFDAFMEKYPNTEHKEQILHLTVESQYLLAINSIASKKEERLENTIKRYRTFANAFPNSKWLEDAESYKVKAEKKLLDYLK